MKNLSRFMLCFLSLAGAMSGLQRPLHAPAKPTRAADPCKLLSSADIRAVQEDALQETKPSTQPSGGLVLSQCVFRTADPGKSVSVAIASAGSASPRAFWQKQFQSANSTSEEKEHEKSAVEHKQGKHEEDEESTRPRKIAGVGEQAYWVGSPMVGALYVLKGNSFLRISVGGVREEPARIQKSIALARLALKRM